MKIEIQTSIDNISIDDLNSLSKALPGIICDANTLIALYEVIVELKTAKGE